jgi:triose/dihydroxyacetone kinase / FAD-AMP lyase (cyclizing)
MSATKKLINSIDNIVDDAVEGLLLVNPSLSRVEGVQNVVVRSDINLYKENNVTLISGGGSGHEPAHAGFIGDGMLSCAILGNVFASPSVNQIIAGIRVCCGPKGCLLIVKNYTGDRLNFGIALEKARSEGYNVQMIDVADDAALSEGKGITGGRGIAGTCFVHKIAGASAKSGANLDEVYANAKYTAENVRSMGCALTTCTVPGTKPSERLLDPTLYEIGLGIHGESGLEQKTIENNMATIVSDILTKQIVSRLANKEGECAIMINNLGALSMIELLVITGTIIRSIEKYTKLYPIRAFVGTFMTSLEMAGLSLSILPLNNTNNIDLDLCARLDANTSAIAWQNVSPLLVKDGKIITSSVAYTPPSTDKDKDEDITTTGDINSNINCSEKLSKVVETICNRLIDIEKDLTKCDSICGDGDCGLVLKKGCTTILNDMNKYNNNNIIDYCNSLADSISSSMGGTSGILLELFFRAISNAYKSNPNIHYIDALKAGTSSIQFYGGAQIGMRTMLDALIPGVENLSNGFDEAAKAATKGCETTKTMTALAGRSNYLNFDVIKGIEDPGALAVAIAFQSAAEVLK